MPRVGFKPTIPVFDRAKTVHALDPTTIVIDHKKSRAKFKLQENYLPNKKLIFFYQLNCAQS
jgi:hypothetical protein